MAGEEVSIGLATDGDVSDLAAVHLETVLHGYAGIFAPGAPSPTLEQLEADWAAALSDPKTTVLVATTGAGPDRRVVGTVRAGPHPDFSGEGNVSRLHVLPAWWDRRVGRRLHDAAVSALQAAGWPAASLWVLEGNGRARSFYERRGWTRVSGHALDRAGLPPEVRYRYQLSWAHADHDAVSAEVRSWFTESTPEIGIRIERRWFGFVTDAAGPTGARAVLTVDRAEAVVDAVSEARALYQGHEFEVWVDDRGRADRLGAALAGAGCRPVQATTFLALVGPVCAHPGPAGLTVEEVDETGLPTWAAVKLRGFADSEELPDASLVASEAVRRRAEAPVSRYQLGILGDEPAAVLAFHTGADQQVFNLATRVPYRHRGIGQALLGRWARQAAADGCRSMIINADDNGPAAALYRRMGFVDEIYWYRRYRSTAPSG